MKPGIICMVAVSLSAQTHPPPKPIPDFKIDTSKLANLGAVHIHTILYGGCKGKPDHVYGDSASVYYACISGQDVCTTPGAHRGVGVPRALITQYQQVKVMLKAQREAERAKLERARQEHQERSAREGRKPNLARFNRSKAARTDISRGPARTVEVATVNRTNTVPLADARLDCVVAGATLSSVIEALGNPYSRISGESEQLTYRLESGGAARLVFEHSVLTRIERSGP